MASKNGPTQSQAPILTDRKLLTFRKSIDGRFWFVYWVCDEEILGITDANNTLYERFVSNVERKEFLGNVSETLLSGKWARMFEERSFTPTLTEDEAELSYVIKSINVPKVNDQEIVHDRISMLFNILVERYTPIVKRVSDLETKEQAKYLNNLGAKRNEYRGEAKVPVKTRRTRAPATGRVAFDDKEEDERNEEEEDN